MSSRIFAKEELIRRVHEQNKKDEFYRIPALNYKGKTDDGKLYTEEIAAWLAGKIDEGMEEEILLQHANMQDSEKEQTSPIHPKGPQKYSAGSNRDEENIAKRLMEQNNLQVHNFAATQVVDFQVPINRVNHSSQGKVDLILTNNCQTIIGELKDADSPETLLRAMVEIRTYQQKIVQYGFVKDRFVKSYGHKSIQPAVLFFENTQPWIDFLEMKKNNRPALDKLAKKWDILFFLVKTVGPMDMDVVQNNNFYLERV